MSDKNMGRRTSVEVAFEGTDITSSILKYFKSITFTDNEEDEADDLQIVLQDRDGIWMEKWLNDAIEAAASSPDQASDGAGEGGTTTAYTVTPKIGLNVRTGPGTNNAKLGALTCGSTIQVSKVENGWAEIEYNGQKAYVSAAYIKESGGGQAGSTSAEAGNSVSLSNAPFYYTSTAGSPSVNKSGTFYFYDGILINGRYRITNSPDRCGKLPVGQNVTGWVPAESCGTAGGGNGGDGSSGDGDGDGSGEAEGNASTGLSIEAVIVRQNWNTDGKDMALDCGTFELDTVDCDGPPAEVTIKATSLPFNSQIRQTKKTRGWEKYKLSGIAAEMAAKNGMVCTFLSSNDPFYERVEQYQMSDIAFLKKLCHDAGISLKATSKMLVLFDQPDYEAKKPVLTIRKDNGRILPAAPEAHGAYGRSGDCETYTSYHLSIGTADAQYQSCRVSYNDPSTGKCIEGVAKIQDYKESDKNQQLEITAKVGSAAEAKKLAEKRLRLHNKYCRTAEFTMPGSPALAAGVTVELKGWGGWDGAYIVKQAKHTVSENGYTTSISLRKVLEGY